MNIEEIYLVENLYSYNYNDTVFLAADIDSIVEKLMQPVAIHHEGELLFLAHVLNTVIDICRKIVRNYETLEELLKVNWSATENGAKKWEYYEKLIADGPVKMMAYRLVEIDSGSRCLRIIQDFYQQFYSKEDFQALVEHMVKSIPLMEYNKAIASIRARISNDTSDCDKRTRSTQSSNDVPDIVMLAHLGDFQRLETHVGRFEETLNISNNVEMMTTQMSKIRSLFSNKGKLQKYQESLKNDKFYSLNMNLLKLYHKQLIAKGMYYDANVVMLLHLLQHDGHHDTLLRHEFLNVDRLGSSECLRLLLLELQNFQ